MSFQEAATNAIVMTTWTLPHNNSNVADPKDVKEKPGNGQWTLHELNSGDTCHTGLCTATFMAETNKCKGGGE